MTTHQNIPIADTFRSTTNVRFCDDPPTFIAHLDALDVHLTQRGNVAARDRALERIARDPRFVGVYIERAILGNA